MTGVEIPVPVEGNCEAAGERTGLVAGLTRAVFAAGEGPLAGAVLAATVTAAGFGAGGFFAVAGGFVIGVTVAAACFAAGFAMGAGFAAGFTVAAAFAAGMTFGAGAGDAFSAGGILPGTVEPVTLGGLGFGY